MGAELTSINDGTWQSSTAFYSLPRKARPMSDSDSQFSDQDHADIVASITEDDIRDRSQALSDAQETWEELAYLHNPKMPCPECAGNGSVSGGSLGEICVRCMGTRYIDQPGSVGLEMPEFGEMRKAITAYGDALADRALPPGHKGFRGLMLPAPSTVPTMAAITDLATQGTARARALQAGTAERLSEQTKALPQRKRTPMDEDAELGDVSDAEIDEIERSVP